MSKNYNDISYIETYLSGAMDSTERQAFEAQLATDEAMRAEVAAFRQIFTGFDGLKGEAFKKDVAEWAAEAKTKTSREIVPIKTEGKPRQMWPRLAVAATIVLLVGIGMAWWGGRQYSDVAIAERNYVAPLSGDTMGDNPKMEEIEAQFEAAHKSFQAGKYADAAGQFDQFLLRLEGSPFLVDELTKDFYIENAQWTGLLAKFAAGEIKEAEMKATLEKIAADPMSEYAEKAKEMLAEMDTFWRRF